MSKLLAAEDPNSAPSLAAMLGIRPLHQDMAERLRAAQHAAVDRLIWARTLAGIVSVALVVLAFRTVAPLWMLGAWTAVSLVGAILPVLFHVMSNRSGDPDCDSAVVRRNRLLMIMQGLLWSVPMHVLAPHGSALEIGLLWTVTSCLMTGVAVSFYATPAAALLFLGLVGGSSVLMMVTAGGLLMAGTVAAFSVMLVIACLRQAQLFGVHVATHSQLAEKQETVSMLLREYDDSASDWLWQTDASRRLTGVTPYFARVMRIDAADIEGKSFLEILAGSSWQTGNFDPALHELAAKLKAREAFTNFIIPVEVEGVRRWWELSASPRLDERGAFLGFRGVGSDVTVQQEATERIAQLAKFDLLTKLPNRLHLTETIGLAIEQMTRWNTRCAFLMIDLDRFKAVNDTLGHQVGDQLLVQVAERLRAVCGDKAVCGRLGGDEFAVVIHDLPDPAFIDQLAMAIIERISKPYEIQQQVLSIGASIGSAMAPRDGRTPDTLIRSADLAMYRAKEDGGGKHFNYVPALHVDAEDRRQMEIALRGAIEKGELFVEYQPVVDLASYDLVSFEALVRWQSPEFGLVPPAKFIPLAEEMRLIGVIGEWVLHTACREARNWPAAVGLSVNMSADQLYDPEIVSKVVMALSASGLAPHRLELEVTESVFMREGSDVSKLLDKLIGFGVRLALDDFGTGYSSLGYLSRTRFKTIKIDRSFVQGAALERPECVAIINAVIALSQSLGMTTVAEGVETEEELAVVTQLGCTKVQGFYFGRPMPTSDVTTLFATPSSQCA